VIMNIWVVATFALMTFTRDGHDHRINETRWAARAKTQRRGAHTMTTALVDDPVASGSEQFGLTRPRHASLCHDVPSAVGVRPWGLRGMRCGTVTGRAAPEFVYSHEQHSQSTRKVGR
jgi:hypothetical protein